MRNPGMAKVWHDLAADNRALLDGIRGGLAHRSYSDEEMRMLEAEAARYEQLASEYQTEQNGSDLRQVGVGPEDELF
jgi:hypothetical protein